MNPDAAWLVSWVFSTTCRMVLHLPSPEGHEINAVVRFDMPEIASHFGWTLYGDDLTEFARELRTIHDTRDGTATLTDGDGVLSIHMRVANSMSSEVLTSAQFLARATPNEEIGVHLRNLPMRREQLPLILSDLERYLNDCGLIAKTVR